MDPVRFLLELSSLAGERARGDYVALHLPKAQRDGLGNVWAGEGGVLLLAHLDTVLPPDLPKQVGERLYGPGVGDNSSGVAVLLSLPEIPGVVRGFTVGEEGLGNLKGARALVQTLAPRVVVAVDGYLPGVVDRALGSIRFRASFLGRGGHAWGDRGTPSPVFALAEGLFRIHALFKEVGTTASLNATTLQGGEAVNAIPKEASALLEIRAWMRRSFAPSTARPRGFFRRLPARTGWWFSLEV